MIRVLIITRDSETRSELSESLSRHDLRCYTAPPDDELSHAVASRQPDVLIFELETPVPDAAIWGSVKLIRKEKELPLIALIPEGIIGDIDGNLEFDDFITSPCNVAELIIRLQRLVSTAGARDNGGKKIISNDLVIDPVTCEVSVQGKVVELTFKEYEMLKLLASTPGRVYTRQTLLDRIWGYDYYGGDRTVDVHVRRLRSKIEDVDHSFIETVRNIGYRFVKEA